MMDDIAEQHELATEISDAISNPVGFGQDVDDVRLFIATSIRLLDFTVMTIYIYPLAER